MLGSCDLASLQLEIVAVLPGFANFWVFKPWASRGLTMLGLLDYFFYFFSMVLKRIQAGYVCSCLQGWLAIVWFMLARPPHWIVQSLKMVEPWGRSTINGKDLYGCGSRCCFALLAASFSDWKHLGFRDLQNELALVSDQPSQQVAGGVLFYSDSIPPWNVWPP